MELPNFNAGWLEQTSRIESFAIRDFIEALTEENLAELTGLANFLPYFVNSRDSFFKTFLTEKFELTPSHVLYGRKPPV